MASPPPFNRLLRKNSEGPKPSKLFASVADLERFEAALVRDGPSSLNAISPPAITSRMNPWTKKVGLHGNNKYSWKHVAGWLGVTSSKQK